MRLLSVLRRRAGWVAGVGGVALAGSAVRAAAVPAVAFTNGQVLDVAATVGSGSNTAYLAVDFTDGSAEAFRYNFNGSLDGYTLLTGVEAATSLRDVDTYYPAYLEHFISYVTDGARTTAQYPALYDTNPAAGAATATSAQGITFEQAQVGIDQLNIVNGEIVAFDNSYTAVPTLPATSVTAVPEPTVLASTAMVTTCALLRRRRRRA